MADTDFSKFVPGFDFLQGLMKNAGAAKAGPQPALPRQDTSSLPPRSGRPDPAGTGAVLPLVHAFVEGVSDRLVRGQAEGTGETERLPADLVVSCIGYRTSPIPDVPFDERAGRFANDEGRILPGLYCVGWARRGPSGTIGTNRPDGYSVVELIAEDIEAGVLGRATRQGGAGFDAMASERGLDVVTFSDWKKIEDAEERAAREGAPREKFVDIDAMIRARG